MPIFRIERVIKVLTNAEIKALPTTPILVLAAPGAGYMIKAVAATLVIDTAAGAYTNITAAYSDLVLTYGSGTAHWVTQALIDDTSTTPDMTRVTAALGSAFIRVVHLSAPFEQIDGDWWQAMPALPQQSEVENVGIYIGSGNTGDFTGGHASNSMVVTLTYLVEPI